MKVFFALGFCRVVAFLACLRVWCLLQDLGYSVDPTPDNAWATRGCVELGGNARQNVDEGKPNAPAD